MISFSTVISGKRLRPEGRDLGLSYSKKVWEAMPSLQGTVFMTEDMMNKWVWRVTGSAYENLCFQGNPVCGKQLLP